MKKILITGGTGFVGANLVRRFIQNGDRPLVLIRKNSNLERIKDVIDKLDLMEVDLLDSKSLNNKISLVKPTHIFHLATYGTHQGLDKDEINMFNTNVLGTLNLLNACSQNNFEIFVNTGSSSEYGLKEHAMKETELLEPDNYYGVSKAAATMISSLFAKKNKLPLVTLRLFSPYGYYEDSDRFISTVIDGILKNKEINLSNPNYVRDFIFIDDVIDVYMLFLKNKKYHGDVFNLGSGKQYSLSSVVKRLELILEKKAKVNWGKELPKQSEPKIWKSNNCKIKEELGWMPKVSIEEGLKRYSFWLKEKYEKNK